MMDAAQVAEQTLYWTKLAAVGQLVGAVATAAAVFVALGIALSERRERLSFTVRELALVAPLQAKRDVISFEVTNVGQVPIHVSSLAWRIGWVRWGPEWARYRWAVQTNGDFHIGVHVPFDLAPAAKGSMLVDLRSFLDVPASDDLFQRRRVPLFGMIAPPVFGIVYTTRGAKAVRVVGLLRKTLFGNQDASPTDGGEPHDG